MIQMFITAIVLILSYLLITIIKFKQIPPSISETHYLWNSTGNVFLSRLFTVILGATAILILPYWMEISLDAWRPFVFFSAEGLLLVAVASCFKEKIEKPYHYTSACIWAVSAIIWLILMGQFPVVAGWVITYGLILIAERRQNALFWAECSCVGAMITGILLL